MMKVAFTPEVRYQNQTLLPSGLFPSFNVPKGVSVRSPFLISSAKMQQLAPPNNLTVTGGLTTAQFSLRFESLKRQWQQTRQRGSVFWRFQGGKVFLQITIAIYIVKDFYDHNPKGFSLIMEHELLHVADNIDIITKYMPEKVPKDPRVKKYLVEKQLLRDSPFEHWISNRGLEQWIRDGIWKPEHSKRNQNRDSGDAWKRLREQISASHRHTGH